MLQLLFSGSAEVAAGLSNGLIGKGSGGWNSGGCGIFSRGPDGFRGSLRAAPGGIFKRSGDLFECL